MHLYICVNITTNISTAQRELVETTQNWFVECICSRESNWSVIRLSLVYCYFEDGKRFNWLSLWVLLHCGHFDRNEIWFRVIKCHAKHYLKWDHKKEHIYKCVYFIKTRMIGFYWMAFIEWAVHLRPPSKWFAYNEK